MSPYIKQEDRKGLDIHLERVIRNVFKKGDLTYCIYKLGIEYLKRNSHNYQNISDVCAAMNDAADEMRRRVLNPYEDKKIKENGDIK